VRGPRQAGCAGQKRSREEALAVYLVLGIGAVLNVVEIRAAQDQGLPGWPFLIAAVVCFLGMLTLVRSERPRD
jgi:hypothetical protein